MNHLDTGRKRVIIEALRPEIDAGRFPIKRVLGERVNVEASVFCDGHDAIATLMQFRFDGESESDTSGADSAWCEVSMAPLGNDRWEAEFTPVKLGTYRYTVVAWIDRFTTWHRDLQKRFSAGQVTSVDMTIGRDLIEIARERAAGEDRKQLDHWREILGAEDAVRHAREVCQEAELNQLVRRNSPREFATTYERELVVKVDPVRAGFSSWYEMFPRSAAERPGDHGTLKDVIARLPYVAEMGFDVLYLPPIHPIGKSFRKGKNNSTRAETGDVGSPWGIGSSEGGHKSIHPKLGTFEDFGELIQKGRQLGIEVAMDVALQCSPDHPYVSEHPQWFGQRPDGTIQFAENPPKKYQDIFPFDFETDDWESLWHELKSVFDFWIDRGVRIFRVDNPHTKPFPFWEWCIGEIKKHHPEILFLAEAFTRPRIMQRLAKLGFSQSYTYFAWRNTKAELTRYLTELTQTEVREFFRPNFWPNTPDILPESLQVGGRAGFMSRLILAATLSSNYGIYGPPFEHCWSLPRELGSEEYLDSEKYQVHHHDLARPDSLRHLIARINQLRRELPVLQTNHRLQFHHVDNDQLLCYSKSSADWSESIVVIVNLDPHHKQSGFVQIREGELGIDQAIPYQVHDLLSDSRYLWYGSRNYVELDPAIIPAHLFRIRRKVRTERDFDYYL